LKEKGISRTGKVPVLEFNGVYLTQVQCTSIMSNWMVS
jgi:hypothetical protein